MPDIKLRDSSGVETTYEDVNTIEVPLADGSGTYSYGLSDEELTFSGEIEFALNYKGVFPNLDKYKDRICFTGTSTPVNRMYGISLSSFLNQQEGDFSNVKIIMPPVIEDATLERACLINFVNGANSNSGITKIPRVYGDLSNTSINISFSNYWYYFDDLDYVIQLFNSASRLTKMSAFTASGQISLVKFFKESKYKDPTGFFRAVQRLALNTAGDGTPYYNSFEDLKNCAFVKEIPIMPAEISTTFPLTSLYDLDSNQNLCKWSDFTFATNNGTPYNARWNNMNWKLIYAGWKSDSYSSTTKHWDSSKNIFANSESTLEAAKARYEALKNEDYWYSQTTTRITYNGTSTSLAMLFSRYNHDSAVRTINSLPNVKDYGTCTLTLRYWSGAETDGGKVGDLTEEEIAVATEKGWTVAFNNSTT